MRFVFKTAYDQDINVWRHRGDLVWYGLLLAMVLIAPAFLDELLCSASFRGCSSSPSPASG